MLLSYPDDNDANSIKLLDNSGNVMFEAKASETLFNPDKVKPFPAFNAYSKLGDYEVRVQNYFFRNKLFLILFIHKRTKQ